MALFEKKKKQSNEKTVIPDSGASADQTGPLRTLGRISEAVNRTVAERGQVNDEKLRESLKEVLSHIAVIAFIGPSGTGKSTRAVSVACQNQIHWLIDDGLLINGSRIVAGSSAKK